MVWNSPFGFVPDPCLLQALDCVLASITQPLARKLDEMINKSMIFKYGGTDGDRWSRGTVKSNITCHCFAQQYILGNQAAQAKTSGCKILVFHP